MQLTKVLKTNPREIASKIVDNINNEYKVFVHQYVREDLIDLYGFISEEEKELFLKLISVSGIGPKSALSILASGTVNEVVKAIENRGIFYRVTVYKPHIFNPNTTIGTIHNPILSTLNFSDF